MGNVGVAAMHMALTHKNTVLIFDQTGTVPTGYRLKHRPSGSECHVDHASDVHDSTCYAHSVEYHLGNRRRRPLNIAPDPFASSGSFLSNGTLLQMGGFDRGYRRIQFFQPCDDGSCDWRIYQAKLAKNRWYSSSLLLPGDGVIVVGGQNMFSYEFVPKKNPNELPINLPFLQETYNKSEGGGNLYPFVHLISDGHVFIFANRDSILLNYKLGKVMKTYPRIPGKGSRTFPGSGSSVVLPLDHQDNFQKVEVMICGGATEGAHNAAQDRKLLLEGLKTCGRMVVTGNNHKWTVEEMPRPRLMSDMLILPTGNILIINGAQRGAGGVGNAGHPALSPYLYKPNKSPGKRFSVLLSSGLARMYCSTAALLPDGRVLVGGGNQNERYIFRNVEYPTELSLQAYAPQYTDRKFRKTRPSNITLDQDETMISVRYGKSFKVRFMLETKTKLKEVEFNAYAPPFTTHSNSMNQRMVKLRSTKVEGRDMWINANVEAPPTPNVAPPGYYMLFVVHGGIPGVAQWVRFSEHA
ncbi:hypothetical protein RND81_01G150100 [Saponaria officinalis]|uniref:Galactose oxidase n=1 Tax=Saponaria officinalis TaxID=3572 RepID=A0AAW1N7M6_SAPOF